MTESNAGEGDQLQVRNSFPLKYLMFKMSDLLLLTFDLLLLTLSEATGDIFTNQSDNEDNLSNSRENKGEKDSDNQSGKPETPDLQKDEVYSDKERLDCFAGQIERICGGERFLLEYLRQFSSSQLNSAWKYLASTKSGEQVRECLNYLQEVLMPDASFLIEAGIGVL